MLHFEFWARYFSIYQNKRLYEKLLHYKLFLCKYIKLYLHRSQSVYTRKKLFGGINSASPI